MKSLRLALLCVCLLALPSSAQVQGQMDTLGMHNLTPGSGSSVTTQGSLGCTFCHAPHSGLGGITPLWNQKLSTQSYSPYNSTTYHQTGNTQPPLGVTSSLCLSCHDGTVAVGQSAAYGNIPTTGQMNNLDSFGTTLSGSHPFSLVTPIKDAANLQASLVSSGKTADPTGAVKLVNGNVECTSCHDPHNQSIDKIAQNFLVRDSSNAQLCLACHDPNRTIQGQTNPLAGWRNNIHQTATSGISPDAHVGSFHTVGVDPGLSLLEGGAPIDHSGYFDDREGLGMAVTRQAADELIAAGVDVVSCHHEAGPSQYEIDLGPLAPLALADALVLAKQVVREVAAERGLLATFMARPLGGEPGSGLHLQQHVEDLVDGGTRLTPDGRAFVAGILTHARALAALASPTVNSYKRLHAGPEAPSAAVWAHLNRAALVRIGEGGIVEYRGADPSANPYLLVAGLLAAEADGLANGLDPGPPLEEAVDSFDPVVVERVRYQPLPRSLDEALDALLEDDAFADAFDRRLLANLVDGRRGEAEAYRAHVTSWELERYLDE